MKTGDIILIPFPFAEQKGRKVRPAVVVAETKDKHKDIILSAISSVVPENKSENEIIINPDKVNMLRVISVIKVDRLVTLKKEDVIFKLGKLNAGQKSLFKSKFKNLIEE